MASPLIKTLTDGNFNDEVLKASKPTLVDFWAVWCAPCKAIAPLVDDMAKTFEKQLNVGKVDIDHNQAVAQQYGIRSIPTLLMFKGGKVVGQLVGVVPKAKLEDFVRKALA